MRDIEHVDHCYYTYIYGCIQFVSFVRWLRWGWAWALEGSMMRCKGQIGKGCPFKICQFLPNSHHRTSTACRNKPLFFHTIGNYRNHRVSRLSMSGTDREQTEIYKQTTRWWRVESFDSRDTYSKRSTSHLNHRNPHHISSLFHSKREKKKRSAHLTIPFAIAVKTTHAANTAANTSEKSFKHQKKKNSGETDSAFLFLEK